VVVTVAVTVEVLAVTVVDLVDIAVATVAVVRWVIAEKAVTITNTNQIVVCIGTTNKKYRIFIRRKGVSGPLFFCPAEACLVKCLRKMTRQCS